MIKKILIITILLLCVMHSWAQSLSVESFRALPEDMSARIVEPKKDFDGGKAAIIKIVTPYKNFTFDGGMMGVVSSVQKVGEIWLYVPQKLRRISIFHQQYGILRNYYFPEPIEEAAVYELVLHTQSADEPDEAIQEEWYGSLEINSNYWGSDVYIDGELRGTTPCTLKKIPVGECRIVLRKDGYISHSGVATITQDATTKFYGSLALMPSEYEYTPPKPNRYLRYGIGIDGMVGGLIGYSVPFELRFGKRNDALRYSVGLTYSNLYKFAAKDDELTISQFSPTASVWYYYGDREHLALIVGETFMMNFNKVNKFSLEGHEICSAGNYNAAYEANPITHDYNFSNIISLGFGGYKWSYLIYCRFDITKTFDTAAINSYNNIDSMGVDILNFEVKHLFFLGTSFRWYF